MNLSIEPVIKIQAKVLGCLRPGYLTVFLWYGVGLLDGGIPTEIPMDLVPFGLRMPNSEFSVVYDRVKGQIIAVEARVGATEDQKSTGEAADE